MKSYIISISYKQYQIKRQCNSLREKIFSKKFKKGIDKRHLFAYNIGVLKGMTREWRNWQTRTFEGRVVYTVRVQVPFLAPKASLALAFI